MNEVIHSFNSESLTKSSRNFDAEAKALIAGVASTEVAYEAAFKVIAYAASLAADFDTSSIDQMNNADARQALDRIESGRAYLKGAASLFDEYPLVKSAIKNLLTTMFYAEATLIPFYLLGNSEVASNREKGTKTYIVRHPATGLLKIGRSVNVECRVKSLQTGAGAALFVLTVLDGDRESELHDKFAHLRRHGEWFEDVSGDIQAFIKLQEVA